MQHPDIKIPDDENITIWRYIDFQQCYYLFKFNKLTFVSPSLFDDPLEGVLPEQFKNEIIQKIKNGDRTVLETEFHNLFFLSEQSDIHKYFIQNSFISCWHQSKNETMSMWKLYGGVNKGVAIVTTFKKLRAALDVNFSIGIVEYIDTQSSKPSKWFPNFLNKLYLKRKPYENESEVRVVYFRPSSMSPLNSLVYEHDIIPASVIDRVVISPFSNREFERSIKSLVPEGIIFGRSTLSSDSDDPEKLRKLHDLIMSVLKKFSNCLCGKCNGRGFYKNDNKITFCELCIHDKWEKLKSSLLSGIN